MSDALLHAEILASSIVDGLSERGSLDGALRNYGVRRDQEVRPMYALTADLARLAPPSPAQAALLNALADNSADTGRFLGVMAGTVPVADFYSPANLARIIGADLAA